MATIRARKQANGTIRYTAIVRLRQGKVVQHYESKTFTHLGAASRWAKSREVALEDPASPLRRNNQPRTLASLIRWYIDTFESISKWQRSKQTHLQFLERHPIGKSNALALTSSQLIKHVQGRRADGAGPATVANDLTWIGVVLRAAKSVEGISVRPQVVQEARIACRELRLIGKSKRRERRPTKDELLKLEEHFARRDRRSKLPMRDIMAFAIESSRREAEICRLEWRDNDEQARTGMVRDAKHPREKDGNHKRFKFTPEAWAIIERQSCVSEYVFPYDPKSIGGAFTDACHVLGIENLHFHDLRHEATSRLFERGYAIHEVAQFTLHESWNELKRYTNLRPENVREIRAGDSTVVPFRNRKRMRLAATTLPARADDQSARPGRPR